MRQGHAGAGDPSPEGEDRIALALIEIMVLGLPQLVELAEYLQRILLEQQARLRELLQEANERGDRDAEHDGTGSVLPAQAQAELDGTSIGLRSGADRRTTPLYAPAPFRPPSAMIRSTGLLAATVNGNANMALPAPVTFIQSLANATSAGGEDAVSMRSRWKISGL